jgi:hypothetical protein
MHFPPVSSYFLVLRSRHPRSLLFSQILPICVQNELLTAMVMRSSICWDITPYSLVIVSQSFRGKYRLHLLFAVCFMLVSSLAYSATLKMGIICSSETSSKFHWIKLHTRTKNRQN